MSDEIKDIMKLVIMVALKLNKSVMAKSIREDMTTLGYPSKGGSFYDTLHEVVDELGYHEVKINGNRITIQKEKPTMLQKRPNIEEVVEYLVKKYGV